MGNFPEANSYWINTRKQKVYRVAGTVESCDRGSVEVLYRSDDMDGGKYYSRSLADWHGLNREGNPRFTPLNTVTKKVKELQVGDRFYFLGCEIWEVAIILSLNEWGKIPITMKHLEETQFISLSPGLDVQVLAIDKPSAFN